MAIVFEPVGTIRTPFRSKEGMPIQSHAAKGVKGYVLLKEEYLDGLADLDTFSHIILIYYFHKSAGYDLQTTPFLDDKNHGVFATRAPRRPNPIGISVVRLLNVEKNKIYIENVDMLDETPLLDIKPYVPDFDIHATEKIGWIKNKTDDLENKRSDKRFE